MISWRNIPPELGSLTGTTISSKGPLAAIRGGARDHRQPHAQRAGLLRRRHDPRVRARRAGRAQGHERCERDVPHHDARLRRSRRDRRLHLARSAGGARAGAVRRPARAGQRARRRVREPARQRARVELRRQQLPEGPHAAGVRPSVLERRLGQPARADVRLLPARDVHRQQAARAGCADDARRADRPSAHQRAGVRAMRRATTTSCRGARRTGRRRCSAATARFVLGASGHIAGRGQSADAGQAQLLGQRAA